MNPEEYLIACEDAEALAELEGVGAEEALKMFYEVRSSFDSVDMGDLIQGGVQFRIHDGTGEPTTKKEMKNIGEGIFDHSIFEEGFIAAQKFDPDYDWNDPPLETQGSYWAGPWAGEDKKESTISKKCRKAAEKEWDRINRMPAKEIIHAYFGMNIDSWPLEVRTELNRLIRKKVKPMLRQVHQWKKKAILEAAGRIDTSQDPTTMLKSIICEQEAILEKSRMWVEKLQRILIMEETPEKEFAPIIHDQGVEIDKKWTRLEADREEYIHTEELRKRAENQSWTHRMWFQDGGGKIKKNISGPEALYLKRAKETREDLFESGIRWVEQQTSPTHLKEGLARMEKHFAKSRAACFRKRNWSGVYLTKKQHGLLKTAFATRIGGLK